MELNKSSVTDRLEGLRKRKKEVIERHAGIQSAYVEQLSRGEDIPIPRELSELLVEKEGLSDAIRKVETEIAAAEHEARIAARVAELAEVEAAIETAVDRVQAEYQAAEEATMRIIAAEKAVEQLREQIIQSCKAIGFSSFPLRKISSGFPRPLTGAFGSLKASTSGDDIDGHFEQLEITLGKASRDIHTELCVLRGNAETHGSRDEE